MNKLIATVATLFVLCAAGAAPAAADDAFAFPVSAFSLEQGTFNGTFTVKWFGVENGTLVASGVLAGTLIDENGVFTAIYRTATIPVNLSTSGKGAGGQVCDILHLELGPLDLDLLGLVVHLDKVVLDIDAVPGSGNLLGNLLCAIVGLLDGSNLGQLANLLNKLIGVLS